MVSNESTLHVKRVGAKRIVFFQALLSYGMIMVKVDLGSVGNVSEDVSILESVILILINHTSN